MRWNKVARASSQRSLATFRNRPKRSRNFDKLAIQLSLDNDVTWLEYVQILPLPEFNVHVTVGMIVADRGDGRVAFDLIDERSPRDIDADGLLLLALEHHQIRLVEMDDVSINKEPRASNSLRIWKHRGHRVERGVVAAIDRALAGRQYVVIRGLGAMAGLSDRMAVVSALICQGVLEVTDLSQKIRSEFSRGETIGVSRRRPQPLSFGDSTIRKGKSHNEDTLLDLKDWTRVAQEDPCRCSRNAGPEIRTLRAWAIAVLQEAGAIRKCEEHGWLQDRADPDARAQALGFAGQDPPVGVSRDEAIAEIKEVLESMRRHLPGVPARGQLTTRVSGVEFFRDPAAVTMRGKSRWTMDSHASDLLRLQEKKRREHETAWKRQEALYRTLRKTSADMRSEIDWVIEATT